MLNKKHFVTEINKLSLNFALKKADDEYLKFMYEQLNEEELTNEQLSIGVKIIINEKDKLYSLPSKAILVNSCCWGGTTPRKMRIRKEVAKENYLEKKKTLQIEGDIVSADKASEAINLIFKK